MSFNKKVMTWQLITVGLVKTIQWTRSGDIVSVIVKSDTSLFF